MRFFSFTRFALLTVSCVIGPSGCGTNDFQPEGGESAAAASQRAAVTVSVTDPNPEGLPKDGSVIGTSVGDADKTTALLTTIRQLRTKPFPEDIDGARTARRKRNLYVVHLATEILHLTIDDVSRKQQFEAAIKQLLESRFQLALCGDSRDIDQLYADVQALNDRDPESNQAADGIYYLARFAHAKARLLGRDEHVWFENFSRWSREFADRFPSQQERAVSLLFGAGRSCEMHAVVTMEAADALRLRTEAKLCYSTLAEQFGDTSQGREAVAVLRRMALPGTQLSQFAGPMLNGGYVSADEFRDRVTVIYFWDTSNQEFRTQLLPLLKQANEVSNDDQLRFIGVSLDEDEAELRSFLTKYEVPGQQIFHSDPTQRGWENPLVRYWGISRSPSVWLIQRDGFVQATDVGGHHLVETMRKLFE